MDEPQLDVQVEQPPQIAVANAGCDEACNCIDSGVKTHADAPREPTGAATASTALLACTNVTDTAHHVTGIVAGTCVNVTFVLC